MRRRTRSAAAARARARARRRGGTAGFARHPRGYCAAVGTVPLRRDLVVPPGEASDRVVRLAFSARRKTLANGLKPVLTREQIGACDVDPGIRPEQVTPAQFAQLAGVVAAQNQTR